MTPFLVTEFGKPAISNLVKECFGSDFSDVHSKLQVDYIFRYLNDLDADSVLLEPEYVDKDYLEDHSKFYVGRFNNRGHKCARLHFFSKALTHVQFEQILERGCPPSDRQMLQESYLGFMVVKPLPKTFIGKTCLKLYPRSIEGTDSRQCLRRPYTANLFGIALTVDSIAFQEQDKVISACATTAIWSALNGLDWLNVRDIPSSCEITKTAINYIPDSSNSFPSKELSVKQILRAIDCQGARHHLFAMDDLTDAEALQIVKTHIRSGLPLILRVNVYKIQKDGTLKPSGGHAITIVGYETTAAENCLFVHDVRLGPFARAAFIDPKLYTARSAHTPISHKWALTLRKKTDNRLWENPHEVLVPTVLIAITDKKVRLSLTHILDTCRLLKRIYTRGCTALSKTTNSTTPIAALDFEIELIEAVRFKQRLLAQEQDHSGKAAATGTSMPYSASVELLTQSFARFQWVAHFGFNGTPAFSILFDATDIPQGHAVSAVRILHAKHTKAVMGAINAMDVPAMVKFDDSPETLVLSFIRRMGEKKTDLHDHLDQTYGTPRAPLRLRPEEMAGNVIVDNPGLKSFYEAEDLTLAELFPQLLADPKAYMLWVIDHEGTLLIGPEKDKLGHPSLTGYKPARIAGELRKAPSGWLINSDSGRYSGNYHNSSTLHLNAVNRFKSIFYKSRDELQADPLKYREGVALPLP